MATMATMATMAGMAGMDTLYPMASLLLYLYPQKITQMYKMNKLKYRSNLSEAARYCPVVLLYISNNNN